MVLSIAIILFVGLIAYFHFVQGFFSATLSAFAVVLAAVLAVGYDETLVHLLMRGSLPDGIHAICLVMLFVVGYIVLRLIFDRAVPGNVRVPATINYIGAGLMGLVAGAFTMGIFAIAVQMLPFDATVSWLGIPRYPMYPSRDVVLPVATGGRMEDSHVRDQMKPDVYDSTKEEPGLFVPVDTLVLDTASWVSGGSLSTGRPLDSVHPDWLGELFAQRASIQTGTRHVALVTPASPNVVGIEGCYRINEPPAVVDSYESTDRSKVAKAQAVFPEDYKIKTGTLTVPKGKTALAVRVRFTSKVTDDEDHIVRFGPGSVRLVTRQDQGEGDYGPATNYYPVGTLQDGEKLVTNRADDFLFVSVANGDAGFDAVFVVPETTVVKGKDGNVIAAGTFIDVKRMAVLDLSGVPVTDGSPPKEDNFNAMRTDVLKQVLNPEPTKSR